MGSAGRVFKRGRIYWIAYSWRGKEYRESSRSPVESDARELLEKRLAGTRRGDFAGFDPEALTFEKLAGEYLQDFALRGSRSHRWARARVGHLMRYFGRDWVTEVTADRIKGFAQSRLEEGASPATVNRDLAALSRMFTIAVQTYQLTFRPHIARLREPFPRQGFMEHFEYIAIRTNLPPDYQDVLDLGYFSGWRRGEIVGLEWRDIDLMAGVVRLRPELSKNREGRLLVFSEPLRELFERRRRVQICECPFVFHVKGRPIGDWRKSWKRACETAGFPGKLFHDLRRTAVRNLIRAGVTERIAMSVTGHKTRSVFDRYNIVNEADLREATARLARYVSEQQSLGHFKS